MKQGRWLGQVGLAVVVAALAGLVWLGRPSSQGFVGAIASPSPSPIASPSPSPTAEPWNLDDDVGAVLVVSTRGMVITPVMRSLLTAGKVGGVLLFGSNFGDSAAGIRAWSDRLKALAESACLKHPILLMTDEEGGSVAQVKAPFAPPAQLVMGAGGPAHVRALEKVNGAGLRAAGVGLDLAPVSDVRTNPLDDVIGDRSFGSNPSVVSPLVAAAVSGLHDGGVGATLKHYPGLGGAPGNPHTAIETDPESIAHWMKVQVPPIEAGIAAGADVVMTTAVYVPGLGGGSLPALFSPTVVGRLRTQLGFTGVIMSDSLSLGGIGVRWPLPQAAVMALAAGNDMLLLSNGDPSYEAQARAAIRAAVLSGKLSRARLHASALRDNALRDRWGRTFTPCQPPATP